MKTNSPLRRALAVLATGLVLGGIFAAFAQTPAAQYPYYVIRSNYVAGTVAPYNAGGGVPAQSYITSQTYTATNCTLKWYGMQGWYSVLGATSVSGPWNAITNVEAMSFVSQAVLPIPATSNNYSFFQLSQANSFAGSGACGGCHGVKYTPYLGTKHAAAYGSASASANFSLACRTVGYGQPTGFVDPSTNANLENVGCENCHGPAGWHKDSDHSYILPVASVDPAICGTCHQGPLHPTYQEYTNLNATALSPAPMGVLVTASHNGGGHNSFGGAVCHNAVNRQTMINEYNDKLAGNPHPVTILTSSDIPTWTATCATCHDPHASNNVAQLRYPTFSTNYYCMPTVTDVRTVLTTNFQGAVTSTSVNMNTVFDAVYNPKIQVCAQCHSGGRGMRWNGTSYGLVTNQVASGPVTNIAYVPTYTTVTNSQVFTNAITGLPYTNTYISSYQSGFYATNVVTLTQTNPVVGVGVVTPLIAYTNNDSSIGYTTNSSGFSVPHYPVQYNILIGQADFDYASNGVPNKTHAHTTAPDQCATCHVPNYAVNAGTNVTGHSFVVDFYGCQSSCHSSYSTAALTAKIANQKTTQSNSMDRVVSLLKQWATNVAPAILRTNYGPLAWEFPSIGALSKKVTNNGVVYAVGPPSSFKFLTSTNNNPIWPGGTNWLTPSFTNDNLQLSTVPQDIRMARFSLYVVYEDQSLGVHNPSYVSALLADAETRVMNQFTTSNYPASFAANTLKGFAPLNVAFTNYGAASSYSWAFGDGGTTNVANPTYTYSTPGLYSVTCTADGSPLTRTKYIWVQQRPTVAFTADNTTVAAGTTVNFSNTSSNTNDVYLWRWYPMYNTNSGVRYDTAGGALSFTYTNAGTYDVRLRASCPAGTATNTVTGYITVQ